MLDNRFCVVCEMIVQFELAETLRVADAAYTVTEFGPGSNAIPLAKLFVYLVLRKIRMFSSKFV